VVSFAYLLFAVVAGGSRRGAVGASTALARRHANAGRRGGRPRPTMPDAAWRGFLRLSMTPWWEARAAYRASKSRTASIKTLSHGGELPSTDVGRKASRVGDPVSTPY